MLSSIDSEALYLCQPMYTLKGKVFITQPCILIVSEKLAFASKTYKCNTAHTF